MPFILTLILLAIGVFGLRLWTKYKTRQRLLVTPLSQRQQNIVLEHVPLYGKVPFELRNALDGKINLFLHQVTFHGCNGLEVTEEMRLSIAAQACILIANKSAWYKNLRTILIYPGAFKSRTAKHDGYIVTQHETVRIGESWSRGPVILSWSHTAEGAFTDDDGSNVVLHEFAHQIDDLSGYTNGIPMLEKGHEFDAWATAFNDAYKRLVDDIEKGRASFLDPYGATEPQELFAVAVEFFFEKPNELKKHEPAVYAQLSQFFQLDPSTWQ